MVRGEKGRADERLELNIHESRAHAATAWVGDEGNNNVCPSLLPSLLSSLPFSLAPFLPYR